MPIDFEVSYKVEDCSSDLRLMHFYSEEKGKGPVLLRAYINNEEHFLIPYVFNLSFGPPKAGSETGVDDEKSIIHSDIDKMLATVLLFAYTYLTTNPGHYVGIDGSCDRRALLYFKKLRANYTTLTELFSVISGVKYYVRILRFSKPSAELLQDEMLRVFAERIRGSIDVSDIQPIPDEITAQTQIKGMEYNYNYFIFKI
jgi:hypothetical protein